MLALVSRENTQKTSSLSWNARRALIFMKGKTVRHNAISISVSRSRWRPEICYLKISPECSLNWFGSEKCFFFVRLTDPSSVNDLLAVAERANLCSSSFVEHRRSQPCFLCDKHLIQLIVDRAWRGQFEGNYACIIKMLFLLALGRHRSDFWDRIVSRRNVFNFSSRRSSKYFGWLSVMLLCLKTGPDCVM